VFLNGARAIVTIGKNNCQPKAVGGNFFCGVVYVDLNGYAGPNVDGIDYFAFLIYSDGILPAGDKKLSDPNYVFEKNCTNYTSTTSSGKLGMCSSWLLTNKNLDYLHCNKLSWTGEYKCK
jgi:hypothetical protein